jgi:hypothetical protein
MKSNLDQRGIATPAILDQVIGMKEKKEWKRLHTWTIILSHSTFKQ